MLRALSSEVVEIMGGDPRRTGRSILQLMANILYNSSCACNIRRSHVWKELGILNNRFCKSTT